MFGRLEIRNRALVVKDCFSDCAHGTFTFYRILINSRRYLRVAAHSQLAKSVSERQVRAAAC